MQEAFRHIDDAVCASTEPHKKGTGGEAKLWRMGGSIAQRDRVEWTLTKAAIHAGLYDVALSLTNERLPLKPESAVNRHFLEEAQAISICDQTEHLPRS